MEKFESGPMNIYIYELGDLRLRTQASARIEENVMGI